jgi:hypothetical protein
VFISAVDVRVDARSADVTSRPSAALEVRRDAASAVVVSRPRVADDLSTVLLVELTVCVAASTW